MRSSRLLDLVAQRSEIGVGAQRARELVVGLGHALLAQLEHADLEVDRLVGHVRVRVVLGEGQREGLLIALGEPDQLVLETGHETLAPEDQRHPIRLDALHRRAVARAREPDHRVVVGRRAAALDGHERCLLVAQLLDDLVDRVIVDLVDGDAERILGVGAELDLRTNRQRDPIGSAAALLERQPLRLRDRQHVELGVLERLEDRMLEQVFLGVVVDRVRCASESSRRTPSSRSRTGRGTLPGRKPGTFVRRAR